MKQDDYPSVEKIFQSAIKFLPEGRNNYLDQACNNDENLRSEVEQLLKQHDSGSEVEPSIIQVAHVMIDEEADRTPTKPLRNFEAAASFSHYKIISQIGKGGMGDVYLAEDTNLNRKVAVKFLSKEFSMDTERLSRFVHEAKAASSLNHPNIITVHEIGDIDSENFIVTEYVDGKTLGKLIREEKVGIKLAVDIAIQIASALAIAHDAGIIHRDIKPDNIMMRSDGIVKVLDFGLAKTTVITSGAEIDKEASTRAKVVTNPGMVLGTPQYMSPEQATGQDIDARSDVFSFGVVLFQMITGHLPFQGDNAMEFIGSILKDESPPLEKYIENPPAALKGILEKALNKDKEQRYQKVHELLIELNKLKDSLKFESVISHNSGYRDSRKTAQNSVQVFLTGRLNFLNITFLLVVASAIALSVWWYIDDATAPPQSSFGNTLETVEITNWPSAPGELSSTASFSPDGKYIAFGSTKMGTISIWVAQTNSGEILQLTKDDYYNRFPVWSPNGEELAFYSKRGDSIGIWRISALGGQVRLIGETKDIESQPKYWAGNGKIYYQGANNLYALDAETGKSSRITDFDRKMVSPTIIRISPEEARIAFLEKNGDEWKINVKPTSSAKSVEIFASDSRISNLVWHPDGERILFSLQKDKVYQIFEIDRAGGDPVQISSGDKDVHIQDVSSDGEARILVNSASEFVDLWKVNVEDAKESIIASDANAELWADVSPDGKTVAYQSIHNLSQGNNLFNGRIMSMSTFGSDRPVLNAESGFLPQWSPDGKSIAFLRQVGKEWEIWNVSGTGGGAVRLAGGGIQHFDYSMTPYNQTQTKHISWSPDNAFVAYPATRDGVSNIWVVSADGSTDKKLTQNKSENLRLSCPIWSANGKMMAIYSNTRKRDVRGRRTYQLLLYDLESGKMQVVIKTNEPLRVLGFSEGDENVILAFWKKLETFSHNPPETDLYEISVQTGERQKINTLNDAYFYNIHLSPDRKTIGYSARSKESDEIWVIPLKGGVPRRLTRNSDPRLYYSSLAWSLNNDSLFLGKQSRFSQLSMMVNAKRNGEKDE